MTRTHPTEEPGALPSSKGGNPADFRTTHWSVVLQAADGDTTHARAALEKLCNTYWYPLYAYVRRKGHSPEDAKDLTQAFFLRMLETQSFANADPNLGRFRSFMLGAMNHFLISEWKRAHAQRRGGCAEFISLDWAAAEQRYALEPSVPSTVEEDFDRQWATALLDEVLNQLENEYGAEGRSELFRALKRTLAGRGETQPYVALAKDLGMSEAAIKVAVHRLRKRYRALLHSEVGKTVNSTKEIEDELTYLFRAMSAS